MELMIIVFAAAIPAMTPLLIAGIGELVCEKSGVLNLGVEGMMLVGSVGGFIIAVESGSLLLGFLASMTAAMLLSLIFACLTIVAGSNQIASGLALTIFGVGLSAFIGLDYVGVPLEGLPEMDLGILSSIEWIGPALFRYDGVVYLSLGLLVATYYFLQKTRHGLILKAVGESHNVAYSMGYNVVKIRILAVLFGGAMAGLAGGYLSLVYTPLWSENMTAGRGWIVLALVVFSAWHPIRLLFGVFLFGLISISQLFMQGLDEGGLSTIPSEFFSMLPYLATIGVLVLISMRKRKQQTSAPSDLGNAFTS